ncbi:molybdopterin molybdotransferase MoeA [Paenibacillus hexagrammi]|uniref:Molybdopterin molybdenumtransferase n=1 Tax=Paenibacillus hexagrammi TaxID=2908839 RepID=A0ABY3SGW8_9BACL|nr:gephyrin-like molybdotransferase Glp [Paenibacillus sp. YPD9-1]UJF32424.1 molybdopterin molybdotransferase MoeA [Paenibacillus sp. YPD9-1]
MTDSINLKFGRSVVTVEQAWESLVVHLNRMETEHVPLASAFGRRLAVPVHADHDVPHFRRSGVDGYAVRAADIGQASFECPVTLQVTEHIPSGTMPQQTIGPGMAARIMTGAPVPDGADAVVMLEMTDCLMEDSPSVGIVQIKKAVPTGSNITPVAGEVGVGEHLIKQGERVGPGEAAILATFGYSHVPVYKKPVVAIFSTGSELLNVEKPLQPGRIRNSNSYMLAFQVEAAGGVPVIMPALPDDVAEVKQALERAFESADFIITSGGVSVGDYDVLVELFGRWDGNLLFNKVSMRPGTPTSAAIWKEKLLLALSGNPGASFVGFELFAGPCIRAMQGCEQPFPVESSAYLDIDYGKGSAYPRYVRGTTRVEDGVRKVQPAGIDKSSIMVSIKDADCLIKLPAGGGGFRKGVPVAVYSLES